MMHCAVLGSPIDHSLSPVLHRAAYAELGLDWTYDAVDVDSEGLPAFLDGLDGSWRGLSLTMPLKRTVVPLLDQLDGWAGVAEAANTVVLDDGRRLGHNTDVPGAMAALSERDPGEIHTAVVLGGGATAASLLLALDELGCRDARLLVREPARAAETLAAVERNGGRMNVTIGALGGHVDAPDVLASTIPAAAQDADLVAACASARVVFEVVYDVWPTPLAASARADGRTLVGGLDLLVHQAALQVRLMTGREAPLETMRTAGERALADRSTP